MVILALDTPAITSWLAADDNERERLQTPIADRAGETHLMDIEAESSFDEADHRVASIRDVLTPIFNGLELDLGETECTHEFDEIKYVDLLGERGAVRGFTYRIQLSQAIREFTVGNASSVAALIFQSVEATAPGAVDRVIYDTDLAALTLDGDGAVTPRPRDQQQSARLRRAGVRV